jgi:hypothetical protein
MCRTKPTPPDPFLFTEPLTMQQRQLGPFKVSAIGLGCMNICHAYGAPVSEQQAEREIGRAHV